MRSRPTPILCLLLSLSLARLAVAQDPQYIRPGTLAEASTSAQERVLEGAKSARWKYGRWRFNPRLSLRDVGYQENVFGAPDGEEQVSDTHLAVGAGLDTYLAVNRKVYLAAFAAPEYTYWNDLDQLRQFNVNFGAGLFGFFNRLETSLSHRDVEFENPINSELEVPVRVAQERSTFELRLELGRSLFLFGSASALTIRHARDLEGLVAIDPFELDRDEERISAGLLVAFSGGLEVGAGLEDENVDFGLNPGRRSYTGTSPLLTARLNRERIDLEARLLLRQVDFGPASSLEDLEETTGRLRVSGGIAKDTRGSIYASRGLVFSVSDSGGILFDERWGVRLDRALGRRLSIEAFTETGALDFESDDPRFSSRVDDLTAFGAALGLSLSDSTTVRLVFSQTDYSSNLDGADRSISRIGANLAVSEGLLPW